MSRRKRRGAGFTLIELLVVIAIISVLIALLLPAVQSVRESARRTQCANNLMQLVVALQNYESAHEVLPPGVVNPTGPIQATAKGYHYSWIAQMLPQIDQANIQKHLDFSVGVYDARNETARSVSLNVLLCPSDPNSGRGITPRFGVGKFPLGLAHTSYAACHNDTEAPIDADNTGTFFLNSSVRYEDVTDGLANTIFLGEKQMDPNDLGWASGTRATLRNTGTPIGGRAGFGRVRPDPDPDDPEDPIAAEAAANAPVGGFSAYHSGGANFAFGDGSVRFLKGNIDARVYRRLGNRADGEMVDYDRLD